MSSSPDPKLRPPALKPGDKVGIVAPGSPPPDPASIDQAADALRKLGFKPCLAPHARKRHGFLAGSDSHRAGDLMAMFADPKVRGIFCLRGGYGAARLLPLLDYAVIRRNPKVFIGYSDMTSLHCALLVRAGLVSFHGPMLCSDFIRPQLQRFTTEAFHRATSANKVPLDLLESYPRTGIRAIRKGSASGPLIGGNLSVLCTTVGTQWQPPFDDAILFLEEINEPPYRIDRMLTHLMNTGLLKKVKGIALGHFKNCTDPKAKSSSDFRQSIHDVLTERLHPLKVPILAGLPFGHDGLNTTLPVGAMAKLDASRRDWIVTEATVA